MEIILINGRVSVKSQDDISDIREAIKTKEKWVYLYDAHTWINLDIVCYIEEDG